MYSYYYYTPPASYSYYSSGYYPSYNSDNYYSATIVTVSTPMPNPPETTPIIIDPTNITPSTDDMNNTDPLVNLTYKVDPNSSLSPPPTIIKTLAIKTSSSTYKIVT